LLLLIQLYPDFPGHMLPFHRDKTEQGECNSQW